MTLFEDITMPVISSIKQYVPQRCNRLSKEHRKRAVRIFQNAYWENRFVGSIFPVEEKRRQALPYFGRLLIRYGEIYGGVKLIDTCEGSGVAIWLSGTDYPFHWWPLLRSGAISLAIHSDWPSMHRLNEKLTGSMSLSNHGMEMSMAISRE